MATSKAKVNANTKNGVEKKTTRKVVSKTALTVELDKKAQNSVAELVKLREAIRQLEAQKKEVEKEVRDALGEAKVGTINGVKRVEIKDAEAISFDRELLLNAYTEAYEKTVRVTPYTKLLTM